MTDLAYVFLVRGSREGRIKDKLLLYYFKFKIGFAAATGKLTIPQNHRRNQLTAKYVQLEFDEEKIIQFIVNNLDATILSGGNAVVVSDFCRHILISQFRTFCSIVYHKTTPTATRGRPTVVAQECRRARARRPDWPPAGLPARPQCPIAPT